MSETKWYEKCGAESDVVVSSRIRLARNLKDYPFPHLLNAQQKKEIAQKVQKAIEESNSYIAKEFQFMDMAELSDVQTGALLEKHLISPVFANDRKGKYLFLTQDETVSIMINEEDHLRIQVLSEGLSVETAYNTADKIDTLLDNALGFAFHDKLGYLTQCPTNIGTGLRASVMLHLPSLQSGKQIERLKDSLYKIGFTLRGTFGEGTQSFGAMYQLSNQITLGLSEETAIENLRRVTMQVIENERATRSQFCKRTETQDYIMRSLGTLKYARLMSNQENMKLLSAVRMGVNENIIDKITISTINKLMVELQPYTLTLQYGKECNASQRDLLRAEILRKTL